VSSNQATAYQRDSLRMREGVHPALDVNDMGHPIDSRHKKDRTMSIAIIGAGPSGIAMAYKLQRAGFHNFSLLEKNDEAGGSWYENSYPGCEVDIVSSFYSFSFVDWNWSRTHARQPEIKRYLDYAIDRFGLRPHIRFSVTVCSAVWRQEEACYEVTLDTGESMPFDVVVSCVGLLNTPSYPSWPGLSEFPGICFHSSRWEHHHDLSGKRVAFVGTGSTGCQVVPELAKVASELFVYQREPGWVMPKDAREYTPQERLRWERRWLYRKWKRFSAFRMCSQAVKGWRAGTKCNEEFRSIALGYLASEVEDPSLRAALTPSFPFGCKRTVRASTFYASLNRSNVTLVPSAVTSINGSSVVSADGDSREVDVLIVGTGFQAQNYLCGLDVTGLDGIHLHDFWGGVPKAFCGVTVPRFPNFFMVYGPNTNGGGSIIYQNERAAEMVVRMVRRLSRGAASIDTRRKSYHRYSAWIDRLSDKHLTGQQQCNNYYYANGRNVTQFPASHLTYQLVTLILPLFGMKAQRHNEIRPGLVRNIWPYKQGRVSSYISSSTHLIKCRKYAIAFGNRRHRCERQNIRVFPGKEPRVTKFKVFDIHQHIGNGGRRPALGDLDRDWGVDVDSRGVADSGDFRDTLQADYDERIKLMDAFGYQSAAISPVAGYERPEGFRNTQAVNDRVAAYRNRYSERFPIAFGVVDPLEGVENGVAEVERIATTLNMNGVIWHHRFQGAFIADPRMFPLLEAIEHFKLVALVHVFGDSAMEHPWGLEIIAERYPNVTFLALDGFAGASRFREMMSVARRNENVVCDTAGSLPIGRMIEEYANTIGSDRLIYGSDLLVAPVTYHVPHMLNEILKAPGLSDVDREKILWTNAKSIFGFTE
jgi:cation diffusion facilitator CzcD-associated flavoprotein CzcO/predicted TIM-barrel fold metal-dependent hydrolase